MNYLKVRNLVKLNNENKNSDIRGKGNEGKIL
jgi:hypothetical protein